MYQHPKLAEALIQERVAQLQPAAATERTERPSLQRRAGWILVDVGLWLAVPHGGRELRRTRIAD